MKRKEILSAAEQCVCGKREQDYGSPEDNFKKIADLWSSYMGVDFTATNVSVMMALLKIARIASNPLHMDNWVDGCGYLACGGEIAGGDNAKTEAV